MENAWTKLDLTAKEIKDALEDFLINHSSIAPINIEEVLCFSPEGTRYYNDMDNAGSKMQSSLSQSYGKFYSTLLSLLKDQPEDVLSQIYKSKEVIRKAIEHRLTWCDNTEQVLEISLKALDEQLNIAKNVLEGKVQAN